MSRSSGQAAEWKDGPAKVSIPGMSGRLGKFSAPTALITNRAASTSCAPSVVRMPTCQLDAASSQVSDVTVVPNRQCGASPYLSTTPAK